MERLLHLLVVGEMHMDARAMFVTDFSAGSEDDFKEFLKFCEGKIDEVILFHAGPSVQDSAAVHSGVGVPAIFPSSLIEETESDTEDWSARYIQNKNGLKITAMIEHGNRSESEAALELSKRLGIQLIGVSSCFGSVAQDLLRNRKIPVMIWGEHSQPIFKDVLPDKSY